MHRRILDFHVEPVTERPLRLEVVQEHEVSIEEGRLGVLFARLDGEGNQVPCTIGSRE